MKTIKTVDIIPIYVEYCPPKEQMAQGIIYISKNYNATNHLCLCGCGHECYLPITEGEWTLTETENGNKISLTPSILQRFDCKSHYIITNNKANFV